MSTSVSQYLGYEESVEVIIGLNVFEEIEPFGIFGLSVNQWSFQVKRVFLQREDVV